MSIHYLPDSVAVRPASVGGLRRFFDPLLARVLHSCDPNARGARRAVLKQMNADGLAAAPAECVVMRALYLSGVGPHELICVAGPDGLEAMVKLCRAGYERVECARQATCAGAEERCDLLLVVGAMAPDELAATIRRTGRLLRDGGILAAQLRGPGDEQAARAALAALGMAAAATVFDRPSGRLVMLTARRQTFMATKAR